MLIGKFVIMSMLIAILLNAFADSGDETDDASRRRSSAPPPPTRRDTKASHDELPTTGAVDKQAPPPRERWPRDYSMLIFRPTGRFRSFCHQCRWVVF